MFLLCIQDMAYGNIEIQLEEHKGMHGVLRAATSVGMDTSSNICNDLRT